MILVFDIGGSRIRAASWDGAQLTPLGETATPATDLPAFLAAIQTRAGACPARAIAVSIAGAVDPATGIGKVANIPCIDGRALAPLLAQATGLPVRVLNDADCFALAEALAGAGRGHGTVFGIILGTGVGGGLVIGGRLVSGAGGFAGEWGHGPVLRGPLAFACGCGQSGCIETVGSARGLERLHHLGTGKVRTAPQIIADWQSGAPGAMATLALWRDLVSAALAMVVNVVGAGIVPVGGGLSRAEGLVAYLDEAVRARVLQAPAGPLVVQALLGPDAGLQGAAFAGGQAGWA